MKRGRKAIASLEYEGNYRFSRYNDYYETTRMGRLLDEYITLETIGTENQIILNYKIKIDCCEPCDTEMKEPLPFPPITNDLNKEKDVFCWYHRVIDANEWGILEDFEEFKQYVTKEIEEKIITNAIKTEAKIYKINIREIEFKTENKVLKDAWDIIETQK